MRIVDLLLNLACVLLWLNWRSFRLNPLPNPRPVSLAGTIKHADARRRGRWSSLVAVLAILVVRGLFYWDIGSGIGWTPRLDLGVISLPFRSDYLSRMFLFSFLSFGLLLGGLYAWLLLLSVVNRSAPSDEPFQRLVRLHLGWIERLPALLRLFLPLLVTMLLWIVGSRALVSLGIVPSSGSALHTWEQAFLLGLTAFLAWKLPVLLVCALYLLNSYVYLGQSHLWSFINTTGSNLLRPLRRFPFCIGKIDLSPLLGILVVLAVAHWAERGLPLLFERLPL